MTNTCKAHEEEGAMRDSGDREESRLIFFRRLIQISVHNLPPSSCCLPDTRYLYLVLPVLVKAKIYYVCFMCYSLKFNIACHRKLGGHLKTLTGNRITLKDMSSLNSEDEGKKTLNLFWVFLLLGHQENSQKGT